jgi:hypothetical protein
MVGGALSKRFPTADHKGGTGVISGCCLLVSWLAEREALVGGYFAEGLNPARGPADLDIRAGCFAQPEVNRKIARRGVPNAA